MKKYLGIMAESRDGLVKLCIKTQIQSDVENAMSNLGYGCSDYFLSFAEITEHKKTYQLIRHVSLEEWKATRNVTNKC